MSKPIVNDNPVVNFAIAIGQFTFAVIVAGLLAALFDAVIGNETVTVAIFAALFVLLLFISHRITKRLR